MKDNHMESPALPNNFSAKTPPQSPAPKIGSPGMKPSPNSKDRGKSGE